MTSILIGNKSFKNSNDFNDFLSDTMEGFLDNIQDFGIYTETDSIGHSPFIEYEEGIEFYYTNKGMELISRWKTRMQKIYDHYFDDDNFSPSCMMYKEF